MDTITAHGLRGFLGLGAAPRELECLLAVAGGQSSKEAAKILGVSPGTIDKRLLALTTKLGVTRRAALVAEAFKRGIIAPAACFLLALLVGLQHQQTTLTRRPEAPRRVEMRVAARRDCAAWAV